MKAVKIIFIPLLLLCFAAAASAKAKVEPKDSTEKDCKFMPIPYLSYDRTLGASFGAVPMLQYHINKNDTISPQSMTGGIGMFTTNGSWFTMLFNQFYLAEDTWRLQFGAGMGNFNYQFYLSDVMGIPINTYIDYATRMDLIFAQVQRKVIDNVYVGVNYKYLHFVNTFAGLEDVELETRLNGIGLMGLYDTRDNVYYPTSGIKTDLKYSTFPSFMKNDSSSQKIEVSYNQYISTRHDKDIIALRAYGGFGLGEVTFNQQIVVGNKDIRGYTQGKYRGDQLFAIQGEYRWNFTDKMGAVGYLGLATIFNSINAEDDGQLLPGAGVGYRYVVFPESRMSVGLDAAVGKDDWGIYFRIGEAF